MRRDQPFWDHFSDMFWHNILIFILICVLVLPLQSYTGDHDRPRPRQNTFVDAICHLLREALQMVEALGVGLA